MALAVVSYADWQAHLTGQRLRDALRRRSLRSGLGFAGVLFCLGLAATAQSIVELIIGLILAMLLAIQIIRIRRAITD